MSTTYEPVVGMEIHVELKTASKMFCGCKNDPFHAPKPNIYTCPVCLGLPGALPVPNKKAVEWTIKLGLALGCEINLFSKFDRKNYFYPDLAKGYQISQYDQPFAINGTLGGVGIRRVHLEEDTGKLQHSTVDGKKVSLVDFNRSSVPLVEIVTEPDIHSGDQAKEFLKKLHQIVRYLEISDADMEKGSMRLEPNISVRQGSGDRVQGTAELQLPPYKVEVKNINSFSFVKKAIEYEAKRHIEMLERGETPKQETRGWNEDKGVTFAQRSKEEAEDYRYFPEPDIPPMRFTREYIADVQSHIGELPQAKKERFIGAFGLNEYDAELITESKALADFYEAAVSVGEEQGVTAKQLANWIINKKVDSANVAPGALVAEVKKATTVEDVSEDVVGAAIETVMKANEKAVTDFRAGKEQSFMFLFGQTLRQLQGKGDKQKIQELLRKKLQA
jgi:aspartyl-tRNA(Asn)/glutamyl-tRNA(Gln) amidotransferase subunit B